MMTLFGGFAAWPLVLTPALRRARGDDTVAADGSAAAGARRTVKLFLIALVALASALAAALVYQSAAVNGVGVGAAASPAMLARVVTETGYGRAWLVTALATAALAVIVYLTRRALGSARPGAGGAWWWAGLAASAAMLVGPSLTGHAMAASREHHLAVVSDWLHLVAGGFWVGGLFHLALALPAALAPLDAARRTRVIGRVITLFTRVAIPSVAAVFLAGLYNSWIHVGSFGALWGTAYGRTLLVKDGLMLPMLALGALNGFRFGPRADRLAAEDDAGAASHPGLERGFVRSLKVEAALGVLVLLAAAVLVFLTPGRNERKMNMEMSDGQAARPAAGANGEIFRSGCKRGPANFRTLCHVNRRRLLMRQNSARPVRIARGRFRRADPCARRGRGARRRAVLGGSRPGRAHKRSAREERRGVRARRPGGP